MYALKQKSVFKKLSKQIVPRKSDPVRMLYLYKDSLLLGVCHQTSPPSMKDLIKQLQSLDSPISWSYDFSIGPTFGQGLTLDFLAFLPGFRFRFS